MDSQQLTVEEVFFLATGKDPVDRTAFLEATCADEKVRSRVAALLKAHDTVGDFLEGAAVQPSPLAGTQDLRLHDTEPISTDEALGFLDRCDKPGRLGMLAHYEIVEVLGRGGMGIVLRGVDLKLNRVIAIKVLAPQLAANASARRRFLREAQAAAAVSHFHVVAIHAVDEVNGLPYLAMEYISGSSLQQKIDVAGKLPLEEILRIGMQIASGLSAAHAQGLVHRDIKPANILLESRIERVKISDFGLARSIDDVQITQAGMVYGTPLYMSPEQAQGERVDQRSDQFSLGSVMYVMCTGQPPFFGETGLAVLKRVCDDTPRPIRELNPEIPAGVVEIVNKLHAKKPADRFASVLEVADVLGRCLSELQQHGRVESVGDPLGDTLSMRALPTRVEQRPVQGQPPKPEERPSLSHRWVAAAAAILVLLAGFGLTEATGVTHVRGAVTRLFSPDDPRIVDAGPPAMGEMKPVTLPATYTNSIGMEFVLVPKGKSWLGGGGGEPGNEVEIKGDFYLGKYEVTQEEWERLMGVTPSHFSPAGPGKDVVKDIPDAQIKRLPVESVSWDDAQLFLRLLNMRDRNEGWVYRLPKEVEWEYACRGGPMADRHESAFDYYFDKPVAQLQPQQANFENGAGLKRTCKVGSYPPNRLGLFDMHGNVWEWCDDAQKPGDKNAPRVNRGGGWVDEPAFCRAADRYVHLPSRRDDRLGLRVARVCLVPPPVDRAAAVNKFKATSRATAAKLPPGATDRPVKVFILAGDSNMAGRAKVGLLKYQANQPKTKEQFQNLVYDDEWVVREDVWVKNFNQTGNADQKGSLTVGFGQAPGMVGPELAFGHVVGDHFDEQVLLIKTCFASHTLPREFRPPSSGLAPPEYLEQIREILLKERGSATPEEVEERSGATYREMVTEIRQTLANLGDHFPGYRGQGFELAGFIWFQGFSDQLHSQYTPAYPELLANLIRDVRKDLKAPNLPVVIGQLGIRGRIMPGSNEGTFRADLAAVAQLPEFKGNVKLVETDPYWDHEAEAVYEKGWKEHRAEWEKVGSDYPFHLLGSARTFCGIGTAFGEAMIELRRSGAKK